MKIESTIYEVYQEVANKYPLRTALIYEGQHFTYEYVLKQINVLAGSLIKKGFKADDVITIMLPNIPFAVYLIYAVNQIGAIANMVHPLIGIDQLKDTLDKSKSRIVFALDSQINKLQEIDNSHIEIYACSPVDGLSLYKKIYYCYKNKLPDFKFKANDLLNGEIYTIFDQSFKKDSFYLHSSGTSGQAKTVAISSFAINSLSSSGLKIYNVDDAKGIGMLSVLPLFHGYGLCMGVHISLMHGTYVVLMPKFFSKKVIKYLKDNLIHTIIGVPVLYEALLRNPDFKGKNIESLKYAFVGGDYINPSLIERFDNRLKEANSNCRLLAGYGLTETIAVASVNTYSMYKKGSVGQPIPHVQIKAFSPEHVELKANEDGELYITGDTLMNEYKFDSQHFNPFFIDHNQVKWLMTGDYGHVDEEGYVYFVQRLKRIIKVSGVNVFPNEIESVIKDLPYIFDCYILATSDINRGNMLKLFVVVDKHYLGKTFNNEINDLIIKHFGIYALPKQIIYLDKFPQTLMGKVDEKKLMEFDS